METNPLTTSVSLERRMDMAPTKGKPKLAITQFEKSPTGITGLDEITNGGLPKGRL
jgi:hypothetical protein